MLDRRRMLIWSLVSIVAAASATIAIEKARPRLSTANHLSVANTASPLAISINQAPPTKVRNLSLQPEAFKLSRRLGVRFTDAQRSISVAMGTVTIGPRVQVVTLTRRQNARGERIEIAVASDASLLTWDEAEGSKSSNRAPNEMERALVERLTFDSADQFVLAQLRGASYYTVARAVRPVEAGDSDAYRGPLWTIVRVDDPDQDSGRKPESRSRLYYINESTGLIDKIVAEFRGERIEARFSGWTSNEKETIPTQITWTRNGEAIMEFTLKNFTRHSTQ